MISKVIYFIVIAVIAYCAYEYCFHKKTRRTNLIGKGSTVILNSGSPKMTVIKLDKVYSLVDCIYFSEVQGKFEMISVPVNCVEEVKNTSNK